MTSWVTPRSLMLTAWVAAAYSMIVVVILLGHLSSQLPTVPLEHPEYAALRQQLRLAPKDRGLQDSLRELDRQLRERHFRNQRFVRWGATFLLGGIVVAVASSIGTTWMARPTPRLAAPVTVEARERNRRRALLAVASVGMVLVAASLIARARQPSLLRIPAEIAMSLATSKGPNATEAVRQDGLDHPASDARPSIPLATPQTSTATAPPPPANNAPATWEPAGDPAVNWPGFRGANGSAIAENVLLPTKWNSDTGENIRWKSPVPRGGASSPVVWEKRVFLSGGDETVREVYCFETETGKLLWQREVPGPSPDVVKSIKINPDAGYAASTLATDGRRVYAMFATGDLAAIDFEGQLHWSQSLGIPKSDYGFAASLAVFQDQVLIQFDQGKADEKLSRIVAIDGTSGIKLWEKPRDVPNSWASPIVITHEQQTQIITCANPWVIAYSASDGTELWRAKCLAGDVAVSPVYHAGIVYVVSDQAGVSAIRCGGQGDVTESHIAWKADAGLPDTCSPLVQGDFLVLLASYGLLTCYDRTNGGEPLWEEDFAEDFLASPVAAGNQVLLMSRQGKGYIVTLTREGCQRISENQIAEECVASPALSGGRVYVRGKEHLYCIGSVRE